MLTLLIWAICLCVAFLALVAYICMAEVKPPKLSEEMRMRVMMHKD